MNPNIEKLEATMELYFKDQITTKDALDVIVDELKLALAQIEELKRK